MIQRTSELDYGCHPVPAETYHSHGSFISKGMMWDFRESPKKYYQRYITKTAPPKVFGRKVDVGTLAHAMLLEPHKIYDEFAVVPNDMLASNGALSTKAAKEFVAAKEAAGIIVVKECEWAAAETLVAAVKAKIGKWITVDAKIEHGVYWHDERSGFDCRCRPDWLIERSDAVYVLDLKSTEDASPGAFKGVCESMGYWLQEAHYREGVRETFGKPVAFLFVAAEPSWPWRVGIYDSEPDDIETYSVRRDSILDEMKRRMEAEDWIDDFEKDITKLKLNPYKVH